MSDADRIAALTDQLLAEHDSSDRVAFRGAQYDLGLGWVHFPVGLGGLGADARLQRGVEDKLREAGVKYSEVGWNGFGLFLAAPTIVAHAQPDTATALLRPLFTGEEIWCQLFSEPGAGSDLASLATRAVRDGDEWVVNGQKVWNTLAHVADWGMLVTRTDPEQPKHKGMTYFALDMHLPGVEVRPLRQITGEAEFNEVYMTDARVPDDCRIGAVGEGWRAALTTFMNERTAIGSAGGGVRRNGPVDEAIRLYKELPADQQTGPRRERLMRLYCVSEAMRFTTTRAGAKAKAGNPGPEGSIAKLALSDFNKVCTEFCVELLGAHGMIDFNFEFRRPENLSVDGLESGVRHSFLRSRANSIEGGTTEIMKNILGEQVLGLPGEPRNDKDIAWSKVPRN